MSIHRHSGGLFDGQVLYLFSTLHSMGNIDMQGISLY